MPIAARIVCVLSLLVAVTLPTRSAVAANASQPVIDLSTPALGYQSLLEAIERENIEAVADCVVLPLELRGNDRTVYAERLILGSKLVWIIGQKFGLQTAAAAHAYAELPVILRADLGTLNFEQMPNVSKTPRDDVTTSSTGKDKQGVLVFMARTDDVWRFDRRLIPFIEFEYVLEDARWRNPMLRRVLDDLNAGKISDENALHAALIPAVSPLPPTTRPTDRSSPADVPLAVQIATEAGDVAALADCYARPGTRHPGEFVVLAQDTIAEQKLDVALHRKFGHTQGDRLAQECALEKYAITDSYANVKWAVDGDVARGLWCGERYRSSSRMLRQGGKWRIEFPPDHFGDVIPPSERDAERNQGAEDAESRRHVNEVLNHLDHYSTPGSVIDVFGGYGSADSQRKDERGISQWSADAGEYLLQAVKQLAASRPSMSAAEVNRAEVSLSLQSQVAVPHPSHSPAAILYYLEGDPRASYLKARRHRVEATCTLLLEATREIDGSAEKVAHEFTLIDAADDPESLQSIQWTVKGDQASGQGPDGVDQSFWTPKLRKIGNDWKVDVSDETDGSPAKAAARAEAEAKAIEGITEDVKALKLKTLDELRAALKTANVRGTGKQM